MEIREQIAALLAVLDEVTTQREHFSEAAYLQIVAALRDKLTQLEKSLLPVVEDEIRLVTIMFVDIVDSTRMTTRLKVDDWKTTITAAHNQVSDLVQEYEGMVGQFLGDGLLCYFGTTISRADDALRAVYCALKIQELLGDFAQEILIRHEMDFNIRIGIGTGRAVVGLFGNHDQQTLLALGAPTNLAARLQDRARPGEILIDSQTHRLVHNHFVTQSYPPTPIKGFDLPLRYYAVKGILENHSTQIATAHIAYFATELVGREVILQQLENILKRQKRWITITLFSEIGLGKSRLLQAFLDTQTHYDPLVIVGNAQKQTNSYSLLQILFATYANLKDDMPTEMVEERIVSFIQQTWTDPDAEATAHVMGFLAGYGFNHSPYVRAFQKGSTEQSQMAFAIIARWFQARVEVSNLLLVIDNLHALDHASLGLLEYLAQDLADLPGVILGAARPDLRKNYPGYMQQTDPYFELELHRLTDADIERIVQMILSQVSAVPPELPELIRERAEGNPLFVEEFVYMLLDNSIIEADEDGSWRINPLQYSTRSSTLPDGLVGLLQARLDELESPARQVVQIASVVGTSFWTGVIAALLPSVDVHHALTDLEGRGIIVSLGESDFEGESAYRFRHSLYRDVVYSMLTRQNRTLYHRHIALWLAEQDRPEYLGVLADHYLKSEQGYAALNTFLSAARERFQRGLMADTLDMIDRGLHAAREVMRETALPVVTLLWMLQGQVLSALDRYAEASAASQTALRLWDEMPATAMLVERAKAARTLGNAYLSLGRYDEAFKALNRANSLLPKDNQAEHASILRTFGTLFQVRGQLNESLAYEQQALLLARETGDERESARILSILSTIALERGDFATALSYCEQVLEINQRDGNIYYQILDWQQMARIYRSLFAFEQTLAICDAAEPLQARIRYNDPLLKVNRALALMSLGQMPEGAKLLHELDQLEPQNTNTRQKIQLAQLVGLAMLGRYEACYALSQKLIKEVENYSVLLYGRILLWQGIALNALENMQAIPTLQKALDYELTFGGRYAWLCYYALGAADKTTQRDWYSRSISVLEATASSLHTRPELQSAVLDYEVLRWMQDQL